MMRLATAPGADCSLKTSPTVFRVVSWPKTQRSRALGACLAHPNASLDDRSAAMIHGFPLRFDDLDHCDVAMVERPNRTAKLMGISIRRTIFPIVAQHWFGESRTLSPGPTPLQLAAKEPESVVERCLTMPLGKTWFRSMGCVDG